MRRELFVGIGSSIMIETVTAVKITVCGNRLD
jgi:hypothetical protein